jgi:exosortase/archaeosortase family protein
MLHWFFNDVVVQKFELFVNGCHCVHVGIPCNGIEIMGVFACIVLAYKAKWYHKIWIIIVSVVTVFVLNAIRVSVLAVYVLHHQMRTFEINHKYIFNIILYGILLVIFSLWISKFGTKENKTD